MKKVSRESMEKEVGDHSTQRGVTFCQVMREIYKSVDNKESKELCRHAVWSAKDLSNKLGKFRKIFNNDEGKKIWVRNHTPVMERVMDGFDPEYKYMLCQVLRRIYSTSDSEKVKLKLRIAMSMAKSINARLEKYKNEMASLQSEGI